MLKRFGFAVGILLVLIAACLPGDIAHGQADRPQAVVLTLDGELSVPMLDYVDRGLRIGEQTGAEVVILQLNTPGGRIDLMNQMVQSIRASSVPVVVYVAPRGAMAGSAGTIITLAGHAAAMAPETAIGAASPVGGQGEDLGETLATKEKEILRATVRSLAERRPPEAVELAEATIQEAKAASSAEALQIGMIDIIAVDVPDLLDQLDGREVIVNDAPVTLHTAGAETVPLRNTFMEQLLAMLTNANVVFLLLSVGVQALLIELSSPGGWVAGFLGAVCLALATYGLGILPVNWFGIVFIGIAFVLFILDVKAPTHGALTVAGVGSFIAGALILFNSPGVPEVQRVSVPLVIGTGLVTAVVFFGIVSLGIRAQKAPIRTGQESLVGRSGLARSDLNPVGTVQVGGELWSALAVEGDLPIPRDAPVVVTGVDGIRLKVKKKLG